MTHQKSAKWRNNADFVLLTLIEEGAKTLHALTEKLDTDKMHAPAFRMVLTGVGKYAYKRPTDGIMVVPIGCLKD